SPLDRHGGLAMSNKSWLLSVLTLAAAIHQAPAQEQTPVALATLAATAEPPGPAAAPPAPAAAPLAPTTAPIVNIEAAGEPNGAPHGSGLIADVGFMIVTPTWRNNPAYTVEFDHFGAPSTFQTTQTDFDFRSQLAPKIALGWIGSGGLG